jgi:putative nucleotidyltransferase with HDIG domain
MAVQTTAAAGKPNLREKLRTLLLERISSGNLALPTMPATATKVLDGLDQNAPAQRIAAAMESDPVLALEVIRLSNSATLGARKRIDNLQQAVVMLGASRVRSVLMTAVARAAFSSRNRTIRDVTTALWQHSVVVAATARQVAVRAGLEDKEGAYLAGLMHDIGKPVVALYLLDFERSMQRTVQDRWIDPAEWLSVVTDIHRPVGKAVAKHWNLSDAVCKSVEQCAEFDPVERLGVSNVVRFANALAKREGVYVGDYDQDQNDTVLMIGRSMLGLDEAAVNALAQTLQSSRDEQSS